MYIKALELEPRAIFAKVEIVKIVDGGIALGSIRLEDRRTVRSILNRKCGSEMPKVIHRAQKSNFPSMGFSGAALAIIPIFAIFYVLLILPFLPDDGKGRVENILFWPVAAVLTLTLVFQNWARIDYRFFRSLPIVSLIAYFVFAAASVTWAYSPDFAFSRLARAGAGRSSSSLSHTLCPYVRNTLFQACIFAMPSRSPSALFMS